MKFQTAKEAESHFPRLTKDLFHSEDRAGAKCILEIDYILRGRNGWKMIGWIRAADFSPRDTCPYVILSEKEGPIGRAWCHISEVGFHFLVNHYAEKDS